jgi:hypothetical protein
MKKFLGLFLALMALAPPVFAEDARFVTHTFQSAAGATGNGTALTVDKYTMVALQVTISDTATVAFEGSQDGTNYASKVCVSIASTSAALVTTATASGTFQCNIAGLQTFRVRISAFTGGEITVTGRATTAVFGGVGGGGGGSIVVAEEDGDPSVSGVSTITVPNGLLTDDGSGAVSLASPSTPTLDQAFDQGKVIDGATSEANGFCVGGDAASKRVCIWHDASTGLHILPDEAANTKTEIMTNMTWCLFDVEGDSCTITYDPDAATQNGKLQFSANYKPIASIIVALSPRGAATMSETNVVTNQPKSWWGTLTDANTDAFDFSFPVTAKMVGATTATIRLLGVSDNATPAGNIDLDCAMSTYTPGTDTFAAHVTTGEQTVLLTPATQNRPVATTSAAITINGTLVDGDMVTGSCEVDATATTSAQLTDFFLWGFATIQLSVNSLSD